MDIEWTLRNNRFFIVQARPITALSKSAGSQVTRPPEWKLPKPKGRYMRASVIELLPDPLSPLFATLGLPAWSRATAALVKSVGMACVFPDPLLITINGYGYSNITLTPAQTTKMLLAMPRILITDLPRLMRTSQSRWQEAHSQYEEVVNHWQTADVATTSA